MTDFERFLKGEFKPKDDSAPIEKLRSFRERMEREHIDFGIIKDPVVRDMMIRWDKYFP